MNKHDELEIFFDDLTETARREVLEFLGIETPEEGNFDLIPLAVIPKPEPQLCGECGKELTEETMWSEYTCKECAEELGLTL